MVKKKYAFGLNLLTIIAETTAFFDIYQSRKNSDKKHLPLAAFYTQLSNIVATVAALAFLLTRRKSPKEWVAWLRYLSCCMLTLTFTVVMLVLIPLGDDPKYLLLKYHSFVHHVLAPVVTAASYIFCETHPDKKTAVWLPVSATLLYGVVMLILNGLKKVDGPYPFFKVYKQGITKTLMWMGILIAAIFAVAKGIAHFAKKPCAQ